MEHGYVHVEKKGHGPAVVLLHGWGQNLYMMKFLQDYLQNQFTVFNLDLPGFGKVKNRFIAGRLMNMHSFFIVCWKKKV